MEKKQLVLVVVFVGVVAGVLWLRHHFSASQVVRRQMAAAVAAFEEERVLGVVSRVSRSYTDRWGGSYESLGGQFQSVIEAYDGLAVDWTITRARVVDETVRVDLRFVVTGTFDGQRGTILGTSIDPCTATVLWVKEQPGWRLAETEELDIPEYREELERREQR
jgi:hypothetical protein